LQNFALYSLRSPDKSETGEHELRFKSDKAHLLQEMEGFHPALLRLAELTNDVLPLWRCTTREPLRTLHRGQLVVIGDAAHPYDSLSYIASRAFANVAVNCRVKPHIGKGAVSAIEDAAVLGVLLRNIPATGDVANHISQRLRLNDSLRLPRVAVYKYYSDVPFFRNAVEEQKEKCEKFMKPEDLPGGLDGRMKCS
jgi:salicylate hydroxylase